MLAGQRYGLTIASKLKFTVDAVRVVKEHGVALNGLAFPQNQVRKWYTENMKTSLNSSSVVVQQNGLMAETIDDEMLLMSLEKNKFYGLDAVSRRIWELVIVPSSLNEICEKLIIEFDVDLETCKVEVQPLIQKLLDANLVQITSR